MVIFDLQMETAKAAKSTEKVTPVLTNKAIKKLELKKRNQKKKKMAGRLRFAIVIIIYKYFDRSIGLMFYYIFS